MGWSAATLKLLDGDLSGWHWQNPAYWNDCAAAILAEILDRADRHFRQAIRLTLGGGKEEIANAMRVTLRAGLRLAAVLDPDAGDSADNRRNFIFKLPGSQPPEVEMLAAQAVKEIFQNQYGVNIDDFLAANAALDHHQYFAQLEEQTGRSRSMLVGECARAFAPTLPQVEVDALVQQLKDAANR